MLSGGYKKKVSKNIGLLLVRELAMKKRHQGCQIVGILQNVYFCLKSRFMESQSLASGGLAQDSCLKSLRYDTFWHQKCHG